MVLPVPEYSVFMLRTFLHTAVGYIAVNIAATDLSVKSAAIGLAVSAVAAGMAAVMNIKEVE